eukprot:364531-Chlamydomonas_euryale.AAC.12
MQPCCTRKPNADAAVHPPRAPHDPQTALKPKESSAPRSRLRGSQGGRHPRRLARLVAAPPAVHPPRLLLRSTRRGSSSPGALPLPSAGTRAAGRPAARGGMSDKQRTQQRSRSGVTKAAARMKVRCGGQNRAPVTGRRSCHAPMHRGPCHRALAPTVARPSPPPAALTPLPLERVPVRADWRERFLRTSVGSRAVALCEPNEASRRCADRVLRCGVRDIQ